MSSKGDVVDNALDQAVGICFQAAATIIPAAAAAYAPLLLPLLPVLEQSFASGRQKERVDKELRLLNQKLEAMGEKVRTMSDEQYKFINETVLTISQTTDSQKLSFLRDAIERVVENPSLTHGESAVLSRIIRDISVSELLFLINYFEYEAVVFLSTADNAERIEEYKKLNWGVLKDERASREDLTGLLALGLLYRSSRLSESYFFSPLVGKLLVLVTPTAMLSKISERNAANKL